MAKEWRPLRSDEKIGDRQWRIVAGLDGDWSDRTASEILRDLDRLADHWTFSARIEVLDEVEDAQHSYDN